MMYIKKKEIMKIWKNDNKMINLSNVDYYCYNPKESVNDETNIEGKKITECLHLLISGGNVYLYGDEAKEVYKMLNEDKSII